MLEFPIDQGTIWPVMPGIYAEVLLKDNKIDSYRYCSVNKWKDPNCIPAIIRQVQIVEGYSNFILYGNNQYINLTNRIEILPSYKYFDIIKNHFAVYNLDNLQDHAFGYWIQIDYT